MERRDLGIIEEGEELYRPQKIVMSRGMRRLGGRHSSGLQELMYSGNVAKGSVISPEIYARLGVCEGDGDTFSWSIYDISSRS